MPEPLKNRYTTALINELAREIKLVYPSFDTRAFCEAVLDQEWHQKELKGRMMHLAASFKPFLPDDYSEALGVLKKVAPKFSGFEFMCFPGFVELFGLDDFESSIDALEVFTAYSSSEFAVRPFIRRYPEEMLTILHRWARSDNYHVRRLASEGCRPRLPWAMALEPFKKDPSPILPVLSQLKSDKSEYVRRSVANNLNDIAKDHPNCVLEIAALWLGHHQETDNLVKHACRTLLKQGREPALVLFGYAAPSHIRLKGLTVEETAAIGGQIGFSFALSTADSQLGRLRIEYAIDFMKANGKQSRKIFKIAEGTYTQPNKKVDKSHSFKTISTRRHYPGLHGLAILVNGKELASASFTLEKSGFFG